MEYRLDFNSIEKDFNFGKETGKIKLQHNTGKMINILPYTTKYGESYRESVKSFKGAVGEFSRLLSEEEYSDESINYDWINCLNKKVCMQDKNKTKFKLLIKDLFFNNDNEINVFHPIIFNYLKRNTTHWDFNKNLAQFLYNILLTNDDETKKLLENLYSSQSNNILVKLVLDSLPNLKKRTKGVDMKYKNMLPFVSKIFYEDFKFIISKPSFFVEDFEKLLKLYYFFYVSQLSMKMNSFFLTEYTQPDKLYFTLDWENLSKTRTGYKEGWKLLDSNIQSLFSHANCLELLNHNNLNESFSYDELKNIINSMSYEERENLERDIERLINQYKENISDVDFENLKISRSVGESIDKKIYELFLAIDYQFRNSGRKQMYQGYMKRFEEFCKFNFLKQRGSLGSVLNMTEENIIFLTKICIKNKKKIRLNNLYKEYEKRGVCFDRDSQGKISQLFEKLNLIEKKSDSGDAQYVKFIL